MSRLGTSYIALIVSGLVLIGTPWIGVAAAGPPEAHPKSLRICQGIQTQFALGRPVWVDVAPATGRKYRGGESVLVYYENRRSETAHSGCHFIIRQGKILHGPHLHWNQAPPAN
jgi:hypothetical protein